MKRISALLRFTHRLLTGAAIAAVLMSAGTIAAKAATTGGEGVAVLVNGDPITNYDIEQRGKLMELATHKAPPRKDVIDELIGEKLKIQLLRRFNIDNVDRDVDNALTNMARRMRQSTGQFTDNLSKQGVKIETLKSRIKADLVWNQVIRGRYQSSFQFSDKDINTRLETKKPADAEVSGYDYTLRPILFVVPPGSPPAAFEARVKEAEALRARFDSCDQGIVQARAVRYVAVRQSVTKASADLAAPLREVLDKTEMGHLTPPETTQQGVEVYALCGKRKSEEGPAKKEIRDELYQETFQDLGKKMMKEMRDQAMIEYK
jgi:peptidyl-prolyl cis-trans isomerase SurA